MYKIYLDDNLLHDIYIEDLKIYNPKVTLEQNGISSFEFTIYPTHPFKNLIKPLKSIVMVYQRDYLIFRGRVLEIESTTKNAMIIYCEDELAFLCDTVQESYSYQGTVRGLFQQVIDKHNLQVEASKQFKVGTITVIDKNDYIVRADKTFLSTWETIKKKFIELLGGYLRIRHELDGNYIDYLSDFTSQNSQQVVFGENMLSVKRLIQNSDIATVLMPLGATIDNTEERLTIKDINNGSMYIENAENIAKYGRIVKVVKWDDVTVAENLKTKAINLLQSMGKQIATVEINAIDMANIKKDISNFRMHQKIKVVSVFHGINDSFLPMKMEISLFNPKNNKITLNGKINTLTSSNLDNQIKLGGLVQTVSAVETSANVLLPTQLAILKEEVNKNKGDASTKISQLSTKTNDLDSKIKQLDTKTNQIGTQLNQLDTKTNELDINITQLGTRVDETEASTNRLDSQITQINTNVNKLGGELTSLSNIVTDKFKNDKEWTEISLIDFKAATAGSIPEYRVCGRTVEIRGIISPLTPMTSNEIGITFASIPQTIAPNKKVNRVCQGSGKATWLLTIQENGDLQISRYGVNGYDNLTTSETLAFDEVYTV